MQHEQYRHGDLLFVRIEATPTGAIPQERTDGRGGQIAAYGEVTGHAHRVYDAERLIVEANGLVEQYFTAHDHRSMEDWLAIETLSERVLAAKALLADWDRAVEEGREAYDPHWRSALAAEVETASAEYDAMVRKTGAHLDHEDHGIIPLPSGDYRVIIQRVYAPDAIRNVVD